MRRLLPLLFLATPALAEAPLDAEAFEALVTGRTLTYGAEGMPAYGVEHYFSGRRVAWAWIDSDQCIGGTWHQEGTPERPAICFDYDDEIENQCWLVFREGDGLRAEFLGPTGDSQGIAESVLYEIVEEPGSLICGGVGV